jgi:hypothetical protein
VGCSCCWRMRAMRAVATAMGRTAARSATKVCARLRWPLARPPTLPARLPACLPSVPACLTLDIAGRVACPVDTDREHSASAMHRCTPWPARSVHRASCRKAPARKISSDGAGQVLSMYSASNPTARPWAAELSGTNKQLVQRQPGRGVDRCGFLRTGACTHWV